MRSMPRTLCLVPSQGASATVSVLMLCATASASTLSITPDGRFFAIDGRPTFLNGVSYYAGTTISTPEFVTQDLDEMKSQGFNWIRVWAFWDSGNRENASVMTQHGAVREPYMSRLKTLVTECDRRGMILDCTMHRDARSSSAPSDQKQHLECARTLAAQLLPYRNVYIDVANERDVHDKRYVSLSEVGELIRAIKTIDAARLCTASGVPGSQQELDQYRSTGTVDFIAPHLCRTAECPAQTVGTVTQFMSWMQALGFRIPVHLQEPLRRGYTSYEPTLEAFYRDGSGAKTAGAAGWCLHNGRTQSSGDGRPFRSFRMSDRDGRLYAQLDGIEREAAATLDEQIGGTSPRVHRFQAEYEEQVAHGVGVRDGFAWTAKASSGKAGELTLGPLVAGIPAGHHRAEWRLKIDLIEGTNDPAVTMSVTRPGQTQALASRQLRRQDFNQANAWQTFTLPFVSNANDKLVLKTLWNGAGAISVDWITLAMDPASVDSEFFVSASESAGKVPREVQAPTPPPDDFNRVVHIAVVQAGEKHYENGNPGPLANYGVLAGQARLAAAAQPQPDIICFPEFALSGWPYPSEAHINELAEKVPGDGPWYVRYRNLARETHAALLCWLVEQDGNRRYNTGCLIDRNGEYRAKYRKVHPTLGEQGLWGWSKGQRFVVAELDGVRYGFSICADMSLPETVRCNELLGANVILHQSVGDDMGRIIPTRALDSKIPIVLSIFQGGSWAVNADGEVLGKLPSETPGWKTFNIQPFRRYRSTKYGGPWDVRKGDHNLRSPAAYSILTDPSIRPLWTEVFLDAKDQPLTREEVLKRFHGHYDGNDPDPPTTAPAR